eukprot:1200645-Alexandrium_andersonii.AAC.1
MPTPLIGGRCHTTGSESTRLNHAPLRTLLSSLPQRLPCMLTQACVLVLACACEGGCACVAGHLRVERLCVS